MHEYKSRSIEAPRRSMLYSLALNYWWDSCEKSTEITNSNRRPTSLPESHRRRVTLTFAGLAALCGWYGESIITNLRGNCSSFRFPFIFIIASHVVATLCARFTQLKVRMQIVNFSNPTRIASSMTQKRRQKGAFILRSCFAPLPVPERDKQRFRSRILIKDGMKWFITLRETIPLKALFSCLSRRVFLEASESELFSVRDMM